MGTLCPALSLSTMHLGSRASIPPMPRLACLGGLVLSGKRLICIALRAGQSKVVVVVRQWAAAFIDLTLVCVSLSSGSVDGWRTSHRRPVLTCLLAIAAKNRMQPWSTLLQPCSASRNNQRKAQQRTEMGVKNSQPTRRPAGAVIVVVFN
jgi:hypothetical protein